MNVVNRLAIKMLWLWFRSGIELAVADRVLGERAGWRAFNTGQMRVDASSGSNERLLVSRTAMKESGKKRSRDKDGLIDE